jgi:hypothetical protein
VLPIQAKDSTAIVRHESSAGKPHPLLLQLALTVFPLE